MVEIGRAYKSLVAKASTWENCRPQMRGLISGKWAVGWAELISGYGSVSGFCKYGDET